MLTPSVLTDFLVQTMSETEPLRLDQFLKLNSITASGGHAKIMIQSGDVKLNGVVETRRRKKLSPGDVVEIGGTRWTVSAESDP